MISVIAWIKEGKFRFPAEGLSDLQSDLIFDILKKYARGKTTDSFKFGEKNWQWSVRQLNNNKDMKVLVEFYSW
jgi:hypothetical protein